MPSTGTADRPPDADWPQWYATYIVAEQSGAELPDMTVRDLFRGSFVR